MFAGHDTTTSTVAFLFHELARNPQPRRRPVVRPRAGHRRDAAPVPAGVDRAAPLDRAVRPSAACDRPRRRTGQLLLVGQPPPPRRVARARRLPARALRPRATASGSPRAPTSPSAAARACASGCASAWPRSASSPPRSSSASASSWRPATSCETRQTPTIGPKRRDADGAAWRPKAGDGTSREARGVRRRAARAKPTTTTLPTFDGQRTPEPSPLERKSPAHWATKRLLPLAHAPARRVRPVGRGRSPSGAASASTPAAGSSPSPARCRQRARACP